MRKSTIIWLSIGGGLIVLGALLFVIVMSINRWNFMKLSTENYVTHTYELEEDFQNVLVRSYTAQIIFSKSEDGKAKVVCYENPKCKHIPKIQNGTLSIEVNDTRKWYEKFISGGADLTVSIPAGDYAALKIDISTGNAVVPADFSFASIDIDTTTGDVECMASASGNINIEATTGDVTLNGITAQNLSIDISRSGLHNEPAG